MAKLIVTREGAPARELVLSGQRISIGRNSSSDLHLDDPTVSAEHAAILLLPEPAITDLASTNGTYVNDVRVGKSRLRHGDVIRIGKHQLRFVDEQVLDLVETVVLEPAAVTQGPVPWLTVMSGARAGEVLELNGARTAIGKPGVQVAIIVRRGSRFNVLPMGLGNGPVSLELNGRQVPSTGADLVDGDVIEIADTRLRFHC